MKHPHLLLLNVKTNNLDIPCVKIPLEKITLITGVSGSGKSSLVFDTIFAESLLAYGQVLSKTTGIQIPPVKTPLVKCTENLPVAIALEQKIPVEMLKLSVGEFSGLINLLAVLFSNLAEIICPDCGIPATGWTPHRIAEEIFKNYPQGTRFYVTVPLQPVPHTEIPNMINRLSREGFIRFIIDDKIITLDDVETVGWRKRHDFSVVVDRFVVEDGTKERLIDSCNLAFSVSDALVRNNAFSPEEFTEASAARKIMLVFPDGKKIFFSESPLCYRCGKFYRPLFHNLFNPVHPEGRCKNCRGSGCIECRNTGFNPFVFKIFLNGYSFPQVFSMSLDELSNWMESFDQSLKNGMLRPYIEWLNTAGEFNLGYLSLSRPLSSLSAGELQKLRLVDFWKKPFVGTLSIFDEPLKFLDVTERSSFAEKIKALVRIFRQTVIMVDHHPDSADMADFVIELGPGTGMDGGKITWSGSADRYRKHNRLRNCCRTKRKIKKTGTEKNLWIRLIGAGGNNLKDISVSFPVGTLTYVTGPVGSGKTTLVFETLVPALKFRFLNKPARPKPYREIQCSVDIGSVIAIREKMVITKPSEKSVIATFLNILGPVRQFYAQLGEAKKKGFRPQHFSWSTPEGACSGCGGRGTVKMSTNTGSEIICPYCEGKRYREEVLSVRYKGYSIADVLAMNLENVYKLFNFLYPLQTVLEMVRSLNLSHILLGQPLITLSGGELYRIWIIRQLAFSRSLEGKHRIVCFDQPSAGLHIQDIENFVDFLERLVFSEHTVIVCDLHEIFEYISGWIIRLGPGSGPDGGFLIYEGFFKN